MGLSTIVLIIVALIVLTALVFLITKAFGLWNKSTEPIVGAVNIAAAKDACSIACTTENKLTYCCDKFTLDNGKAVSCTDPTLGVSCQLSCANFACPAA